MKPYILTIRLFAIILAFFATTVDAEPLLDGGEYDDDTGKILLAGQVFTNGDCVPDILPCTDPGADPQMCLPDDPTCTNGDCFYYACDETHNKIAVCHNGMDICISAEAWPAHYSHGDTFGGCHPPWGEPLALAP